jgi:AraC family transcriptional regulator
MPHPPQKPFVHFASAGGFRIVERWHPPRLRVPWHVNDRAALTCVLEGGFEEFLRSSSVDCTAHTVLFKPAGELHSNCAGAAGARSLAIELPDQRLHEAQQATDSLHTVRRVASVQANALVSLLVAELKTRDACAGLAIEGLVLELVAAVGRTTARSAIASRPAWLDGALEELRSRFRRPLPILDVAATAGVTPSHFARVLLRHEGSTPTEYVRRLRIEFAKMQLQRTDRPLAAIAVDSGFADQSHFTRTFVRVEGMTPGRFRRRHFPDARA